MILNSITVRHLPRMLLVSLATVFSFLIPPVHAQQGKAPRVGVYLPFPEGSLRGTLHRQALKELSQEFTGKAEILINTGVPPAGIGERIERLETERFAGMIAASPAYYNPIAAHVVSSPTNMYLAVKADNTNPQKTNTFGVRIYEAYYLAGVLAGRVATESGKAGFIGGTPTVEAARNVNAFLLGMRSVREDAHVTLFFTGGPKNIGKERAAADWLMNENAVDVLVSDTDSDEVPRMAVANRVWTVAVRTPDALQQKISRYSLLHIVPRWDVAYRRQLNRILSGQKGYEFSWDGLATEAIEIRDFNPVLPVTHVQEVNRIAREIAEGERSVFAGPLRARGAEIIGPGEALDDTQLSRMNYFIEGVSVLSSN